MAPTTAKPGERRLLLGRGLAIVCRLGCRWLMLRIGFVCHKNTTPKTCNDKSDLVEFVKGRGLRFSAIRPAPLLKPAVNHREEYGNKKECGDGRQ